MSFIARLKEMLGRKRRIGLVLGAGGARGFAHIGVLKVLEEAGIPIHCIAGTSAGAMAGGLYATGMKAREIEEALGDISIQRLAKLFLPTLGAGGIVDGRRVKKLLEPYAGGRLIEHLAIPFACVATDLYTGERVVFTSGDLLKSIRASISIPGLFTPVRIDDRILVDGGVVDPLPIRLVYEMGATCAIVVRVDRQYFREIDPAVKKDDDPEESVSGLDVNGEISMGGGRRAWFRNPLRWLARGYGGAEEDRALTPPVMDVLLSILSIHDHQLSELSVREAGRHVLVAPVLADIEMLDFHKGRKGIAAGEAAMRAKLSDIERL
jgi:NTE family protein